MSASKLKIYEKLPKLATFKIKNKSGILNISWFSNYIDSLVTIPKKLSPYTKYLPFYKHLKTIKILISHYFYVLKITMSQTKFGPGDDFGCYYLNIYIVWYQDNIFFINRMKSCAIIIIISPDKPQSEAQSWRWKVHLSLFCQRFSSRNCLKTHFSQFLDAIYSFVRYTET